ncbi:hypothetical protein D5S17_03740 [Pseudonocardiaceae bacterium YIM PH 21723]|nr:hypothetical protein D5S17_03740 [Pseudonocardiaceae bacterium YIM PH 21723]
MIALIRYGVATFLHSQRYLAPVVLFLGALAIAALNDGGPLLPLYAVISGALFVATSWITVAQLNAEDPVHRAVTIVHAGRSVKVLLAGVCVALLAGFGLVLVGLLGPLLMGHHKVSPADLLLGLAALSTATFTGTAVGLICSRLVIRRPGYSFAVALVGVLSLLLVKGIPPVNAMIRGLSEGLPDIAGLLGYLALSAVLLVTAAVLAQAAVTSRD